MYSSQLMQPRSATAVAVWSCMSSSFILHDLCAISWYGKHAVISRSLAPRRHVVDIACHVTLLSAAAGGAHPGAERHDTGCSARRGGAAPGGALRFSSAVSATKHDMHELHLSTSHLVCPCLSSSLVTIQNLCCISPAGWQRCCAASQRQTRRPGPSMGWTPRTWPCWRSRMQSAASPSTHGTQPSTAERCWLFSRGRRPVACGNLCQAACTAHACSLVPSDGCTSWVQGEAHNSLEQYDAAREAFLEALSLDMGDAKAAAGLRAATAGGEASDAAAQQSPTSPASPAAAPPKRC